MEVLKELGKHFISVSVMAAGIIYIVKSLLELVIEKNIESYKQNLERTNTIEIEKAKHKLSSYYTEKNLLFSKLTEEKANVLKELYKKLVDVEFCLQGYANDKYNKFNRLYIEKNNKEIIFDKIKDFVYYYT